MTSYCEWCFSPLVYPSLSSPVLAQCMKCAMMLNGPYEGMKIVRYEEGKCIPNLGAGSSHGLCEPCAEAMRAQWKVVKQTRKLCKA